MGPGLGDLRTRVRVFLEQERRDGRFTPQNNAWMDGHDRAFSRRLADHGWIGMTWPARYGGGERTALERYVVTEELLAAGAPVAAHWFADRQIGPQLLRFGTDDQRERFLPRIADGSCCFAIGMSEPDAGSDLASIRTVARRVDGGWRLSGTKVWTSHADRSDFMMTLCRSEPRGEDRHAGLSQLIVDLRADGVQISPIDGLDGSAHFCEVSLDDVFVDDGLLVGRAGDGWAQVTSELAHERSGPERFLSTVPLFTHAVAAMFDDPSPADGERVGRAYAELVALRRLSLGVVESLERGVADDVRAALVKDLGTRFEQDLVESLRVCAADGPRSGPYSASLAEAQLAAPGFTLRGGTTEVLRGILGRAVVRP